MIPLENMSDEDFERHALNRSGTGDYTRDRHQWLMGATIQEIMAEVERRDNSAS